MTLNWKNEAIIDLKNYPLRKESLQNIRQQLAALTEEAQSIRGALSDSTPVQGGESRQENRLLDNLVKRERLKITYHAAKRLVVLVEKGLAGLDEREKLIVEKFYIYPRKGAADCLAQDFGCDKRHVYRLCDTALYRFTVAMYGLEDF